MAGGARASGGGTARLAVETGADYTSNTLIRTHGGQSILITHDTNSPRPYSRKILLQGTKGVVRKYPEALVHLEGKSEAHQWQEFSEYRAQFDHPIWRKLEEISAGGGVSCGLRAADGEREGIGGLWLGAGVGVTMF